METINNSNCNNIITGVHVSGGSTLMGVVTTQHVENNSIPNFADELAQIKEILPTQDDIDRLHHAMTALELALRKNDKKTFKKEVIKYMGVLSLPIFVRVASESLVNTIKTMFPNI